MSPGQIKGLLALNDSEMRLIECLPQLDYSSLNAGYINLFCTVEFSAMAWHELTNISDTTRNFIVTD